MTHEGEETNLPSCGTSTNFISMTTEI